MPQDKDKTDDDIDGTLDDDASDDDDNDGTDDKGGASGKANDDDTDDGDSGGEDDDDQPALKALQDRLSAAGRDRKTLEEEIAEKDAEIERIKSGGGGGRSDTGAGGIDLATARFHDEISEDSDEAIKQLSHNLLVTRGLLTHFFQQQQNVEGKVNDQTQSAQETENITVLTEKGIDAEVAKTLAKGMESDNFTERLQAMDAYNEVMATVKSRDDKRKQQLQGMDLASGGSSTSKKSGDSVKKVADSLNSKKSWDEYADELATVAQTYGEEAITKVLNA